MVLSFMDGYVLGDFYQAQESETKEIIVIRKDESLGKKAFAHI